MTKLMKITGRFLGIVSEWLLIFIILFMFAIRFPAFQTYLGQKVTAYLSGKTGKELRIEKIDIVWYDRVYLDGVYAEDSKGDTLADIRSIRVDLGRLDYSFKEINVESVVLTDGIVKLIRYEENEKFNYQYLVDFFKSDKPKKKKKNSLLLNVGDLFLKNIHFVYDLPYKPYLEKGMDYSHMDFRDINLHVRNFSNPDGHFIGEIVHLAVRSSSGFELTDFSGYADVSPDSLHIDELMIQTRETRAKLPYFTLRTGSFSNFKNFVDSVDFNAKLEGAVVSMKDVAFFAPALWGMDQEVYISADVTKKIKNLNIDHLNLETGQETILRGDIKLPDFRSLEYEIFDEEIEYFRTSTSDMRAFRLPDKDGEPRYVSLTDQLKSLGEVELEDVRLFGALQDFTVSLDEGRADVGVIQLPYGIQFTYNEDEELYYFNHSEYSEYDLRIVSFDLGKFIGRKDFGRLEGDFFLSGKGLSDKTFELSDIQGTIRKFEFLDYAYTGVEVKEGSLKNNKFDGVVEVKDENLVLTYDGAIEFGKHQHMDFEVTVAKAELDHLNLVSKDSSSFSAVLDVDIIGFGLDDFEGDVSLREVNFKQGGKSFEIDDFVVNTKRTQGSDTLQINSSVLDALVIGKLQFSDFLQSFRNQFATIFPSFLNLQKKEQVRKVENNFGYQIMIKEARPIFDVLTPGFSLSENTFISGKYNGAENYFDLNFFADRIAYNEMEVKDVTLIHDVKEGTIYAKYDIAEYKFNDSLSFTHIDFETNGTNNRLDSDLFWGDTASTKHGNIQWETTLPSPDDIIVLIESGEFYMKNQLWRFEDSAYIHYAPYNIIVDNLTLEHDFQYVSFGGCISDNPEDKLDFFINDFQLSDINALFEGKINMEGLLNGRGYVNDVFNTVGVFGELGIDDLVLDNNEVGDINLNSNYDNEQKRFDLSGTLFYKDLQSVGFDGEYYIARKDSSLRADLVFNETDISFVNAFFDPKVVDNIRGKLTGRLAVKGTIEEPELDGRVKLKGAGAKVGLLGTDYQVQGDVLADEYGFLMPALPLTDEEGNTGSLTGSIFHENFKDWNFDVSINLETDGLKRDPFEPWKEVPLKKFMVLNTAYKEGEPYYGKAYVTGTANIFGYLNNLEVAVNARTERGTWINFPMYGRGDIQEDGFITFVKKGDSLDMDIKDQIDFTGVSLDLNFDVQDNAQVKIIFNENLGDEITATGSGPMSIRLDEYNELSIEGTYRVKSGEYNFAMGPIKKNFFIEEGGTVQWTGDPYDANLNLRTYYLVNANISEVVNDMMDVERTGVKDEIYCYLDLKESLEKPLITFDIAAPKAPEYGKATINRIRGDEDELNRQFFSLLLFRKFQPIKGQNTTANNAALEIVSNQINSILDQVSQDYKLRVKMDADQFTQESTYEFGVSKGFLDDRLIITGSFGVNQVRAGQEEGAANNFIGDVNLEYKLNTSGTFRVNVFNESNQYSVIQNKNLGLFTQGVGLHYQESFRNIEDFKLIQYGLDIFRPIDKRRFLGQKKNQEVPIPAEYLNKEKGKQEDEEDTDSK